MEAFAARPDRLKAHDALGIFRRWQCQWSTRGKPAASWREVTSQIWDAQRFYRAGPVCRRRVAMSHLSDCLACV